MENNDIFSSIEMLGFASIIVVLLIVILILSINIFVLVYSVKIMGKASRTRGAESAKTLALISLILSILSFFVLPFFGTVIAFVLCKLANSELKRQIRYNNKEGIITQDYYDEDYYDEDY